MIDYELWTVEEFAAFWRVHPQTIYSAIRFGRLEYPVERLGRQIRIRVSLDVSRGSIEALTPSYQNAEALNDRPLTGGRR